MNAKSKAFAFISAALMIGGAFICCSMFNDDSSAANTGSTSNPLTSLTLYAWSSDIRGATFYVAVGSYINLVSQDDPCDGHSHFYYFQTAIGLPDSGYVSSVGSYGCTIYEGVSYWDDDYECYDYGVENHWFMTIVVVQNNYTVSFNSMGGTAVASQSVSPGGHATQPANPTNGVKVFGGWFTDQNCTQAFNFSTSINSNITLYAKWTTPSASVTSSHGNSSMVVGQYFSYNVSTNPSNATVSVSGANWLNVSGHTVYGTPTSPGTYNVTITSSASGYNNGSQSFTVTVSSVLAPSNAPSNGVIAYVR